MMLIERCVTKLSEAKQAILEGADRLELCENLDVDGLTPSKKKLPKSQKGNKDSYTCNAERGRGRLFGVPTTNRKSD